MEIYVYICLRALTKYLSRYSQRIFSQKTQISQASKQDYVKESWCCSM